MWSFLRGKSSSGISLRPRIKVLGSAWGQVPSLTRRAPAFSYSESSKIRLNLGSVDDRSTETGYPALTRVLITEGEKDRCSRGFSSARRRMWGYSDMIATVLKLLKLWVLRFRR